jgi:hypothetical protein
MKRRRRSALQQVHEEYLAMVEVVRQARRVIDDARRKMDDPLRMLEVAIRELDDVRASQLPGGESK